MLTSVMRPLRRVVQALVAHDAPNQIAAGFALGMMLGFMPKGNLIALSLLVLLFSLRVNKSAGLAAAFLFSFTGPILDQFGNKLGLYVLTSEQMQGTYATIFNMPLGPWLEIDNTAVIGSLLLGLYAFYPVYLFGTLAVGRWQARMGLAAAAKHDVRSTFAVVDIDGRRAA
jgi:uncharacterized protein (TIGR03546 family)